jgi:hypothetical protein
MLLLELEFSHGALVANTCLRFALYSEITKYYHQPVTAADATSFGGGMPPLGYNLDPVEVRNAAQLFEQLNGDEQHLLSLLEEHQPDYVIAYFTGAPTLIPMFRDHELAHACYFQDATYRRQVHEAWNELPEKQRTSLDALFAKYTPGRLLDEFQAYAYATGAVGGHQLPNATTTRIKETMPGRQGEVMNIREWPCRPT